MEDGQKPSYYYSTVQYYTIICIERDKRLDFLF